MNTRYEQVHIDSRERWHAWLAEHHATAPGIWLVTWKKGRGPYLAYEDIVEVALCFGWIDGQGRRFDEGRSQLLLTPRRAGSGWARSNKERVQRLREAGLLEPAGLAVIECAQRDGTWTALDAVEDLLVPDDLAGALDSARTHWDAFPRSAKRALLEWLSTAKTETTRARRIASIAAEAAAGRRANQRPPAAR